MVKLSRGNGIKIKVESNAFPVLDYFHRKTSEEVVTLTPRRNADRQESSG